MQRSRLALYLLFGFVAGCAQGPSDPDAEDPATSPQIQTQSLPSAPPLPAPVLDKASAEDLRDNMLSQETEVESVASITEWRPFADITPTIDTTRLSIRPALQLTPETKPVAESVPPRFKDTPYAALQPTLQNWDPMTEQWQPANKILCLFAQSRYWLVEVGTAFSSIIDPELCSPESSSPRQYTHESFGSYTPKWHAVLSSSRPTLVEPLTVHIWLEGRIGDKQGLLQAELQIRQGPQDVPPFGVFQLRWQIQQTGEDALDPVPLFAGPSSGTVQTTTSQPAGFQYLWADFQSDAKKVRLDATVQWSEQQASIHAVNFDIHETTALALQETEEFAPPTDTSIRARYQNGRLAIYESKNGGTEALPPKCFLAPGPLAHYVGYEAFHWQDGTPVQELFGLAALWQDSAGNRVPIWLDEFGLSSSSGASLPDTADLQGVLIGENSAEHASLHEFRLNRSKGKLLSYRSFSLPLADLKGVPLTLTTEEGTWELQVHNNRVYRTGTDTNGDLQSVDSTQEDSNLATGSYNVWSERLGGPVRITVTESAGETTLQSALGYAKAMIFTTLTDMDLTCFTRCLRPELQLEHFIQGTPFLFEPENIQQLNSPHIYLFDHSKMILQLQQSPVLPDADVISLPASTFWGVRSGPLNTAAQAGTFQSTQDGWNLPQFHVWETGFHTWNYTYRLFDPEGQRLSLESRFEFDIRTTPAQEGISDYYRLAWSKGKIRGIPYQEEIQLGRKRWYPLFNIETGTRVGENQQYVLKPSNITFPSTPAGTQECSDMQPEEFPKITDADSTGPLDLGPKPTVTTFPRSIFGRIIPADPEADISPNH